MISKPVDNWNVELEYIGEGICGEYDENDPHDIPLLRFTVFITHGKSDERVYVEDASYCTRLPATMEPELQAVAERLILRRVYHAVANHASVKKICEELSWLSREDIDTAAQAGV